MSPWLRWMPKKEDEALGFAVVGLGRFGTAVCRELLKNGADINKKGRFDKSPLLLVAGSKHFKSAKFLVDRGADIKAIQWHKATCLHEAALWQQPKNLKFFAAIESIFPA